MMQPAPSFGRLNEAPNLNRLWADLVVEELVRGGVGLFCLAPGSRSAPLATAVAAHPSAEALVHFDERGTAFAALGWARATGRPACWITTSGTAVANGFPAIVEAATDGIPLIAVTADRPPELRQSGANQTIDQAGIFGGYVRWHVDFPPPTRLIDPSFVLTTIDQVLHRSSSPPGPVHLNMMFREPLAPERDECTFPQLPERWLAGGGMYTRYTTPLGGDEHALDELLEALAGVRHGIVVAGRLRSKSEAGAVHSLARHLGWPLLPDACSQLRHVQGSETAVPFADLVASVEGSFRDAPVDAVLYVGARATSKNLGRFLAQSRPDVFCVIRDDPFRFDPDHLVTHRIQADVQSFCDAMVASAEPAREGWQDRWHAASQAVDAVLREVLDGGSELTEPSVARVLSELIDPSEALMLASSMPIRDFDSFAAPAEAGPGLVVANRGASGIDGTIATAAGVARGRGLPATVLLGDLALLHDLNSLALLRSANQPPLRIVVLNNDGCGIFHFLPIASHAHVFEDYFGTPHGIGFEAAAELFGLDYERPESMEAFKHAYRRAAGSTRSVIIEVVTDRHRNYELHQHLHARIAVAVLAATSQEATPA